MYKQIAFYEVNEEEHRILGGIAHYDESEKIDFVICGCCGSVLEPEDIVIVKTFNWWVPLCDTIIGDEVIE